MPGRYPKPPDQRIRRNQRADAGLLVVRQAREDLPQPDDRWCGQTIDEWYAFWESPLASLVSRSSDIGALRRMFDYKHELVWSATNYRRERMVQGPKFQPKVSVHFDTMTKLEKLISSLEDRFGMSPAGRLRLGATLGEASRSLADLNSDLDEESAGDVDGDPRDFLDATGSH